MSHVPFHTKLKVLIHEYILLTYEVTASYPKEERYGLVSQDRRSSTSVMLNYVEGHARGTNGMRKHFYRISFGSLKESVYCKYLAFSLGMLKKEDYDELIKKKHQIAAMLYSTIEKMD